MYVPKHFAMPDDAVRDLLVNHGAGDLVTCTGAGLLATFMPFVYDAGVGERGALLGHVARPNDQWRHAASGEALVILHGVDGYITPSWYAAKAEHGRVVPTWNYQTVHVYGRLHVRDDAEFVRDVVHRLTAKHEAGAERPWSVDDAPRDYVDGALRAIVGLELEITRIEAKAKLSQNRPVADVRGVVEGLHSRGRDDLAEAMERATRPTL